MVWPLWFQRCLPKRELHVLVSRRASQRCFARTRTAYWFPTGFLEVRGLRTAFQTIFCSYASRVLASEGILSRTRAAYCFPHAYLPVRRTRADFLTDFRKYAGRVRTSEQLFGSRQIKKINAETGAAGRGSGCRFVSRSGKRKSGWGSPSRLRVAKKLTSSRPSSDCTSRRSCQPFWLLCSKDGSIPRLWPWPYRSRIPPEQ